MNIIGGILLLCLVFGLLLGVYASCRWIDVLDETPQRSPVRIKVLKEDIAASKDFNQSGQLYALLKKEESVPRRTED